MVNATGHQQNKIAAILIAWLLRTVLQQFSCQARAKICLHSQGQFFGHYLELVLAIQPKRSKQKQHHKKRCCFCEVESGKKGIGAGFGKQPGEGTNAQCV